MRLRNLIIVTVIVPLFVVLMVFSLVAIKSLEDNVRSKLETEVETISRAIATSLGYAMTLPSSESLEQTLQSAFSYNRIYGAYVFDAAGKPLHGLGLGESLYAADDLQAVVEAGEMRSDYRDEDGWTYFSTLMPLHSVEGETLGVLQVNRLTTGIENYTGFISRVALVAFGLGAAAIALGIWWMLRRHIERPLNRMLGVMERVARGERRPRAMPQGLDEFHRLSLALNHMLDALAEKEADIEARQHREVELEQRLHKSHKLAELGVLAAGVAHEVGTPLTVIEGQAQRLERREGISDDEQRRLKRIRSEVQRIVAIVRQLMDLGRQHSVDKTPQHLERLVHDARQLVESELDARGIRLELALPSTPVTLLANGQQLVQVLTNLLHNAAQADGVRCIRLTARCRDDTLLLTLEDDGQGIAESDRSRVFDPFFTTKPVGQGSGLGLAMVHRIVNDHGGSIGTFDSALGGAGFDIVLPRHTTPP